MFLALKKIYNHRIIKSVAIVAGGAAMAQIFSILSSPILTRLFRPSAIGVFGIFFSLITIFTTLSSMAYCYAISLPSDAKKALALLELSLRINIIVALILILICFAFSRSIKFFPWFNDLGGSIWLIPFVVFLAGARESINQWLVRQKNFKLISKISIYQSLFTSLIKIICGLIWANAISLIIAFSIAHLAFDSWLYIKIRKDVAFLICDKSYDSFCEIKKVASEFSDFPIYRAPQIFLNSISQSLPVLAFGAIFEPSIVGFYSIGNKVLQLPASLISSSLGAVLLPELAQTARTNGNLQNQLLKSTYILALIGSIPFGLVFFWGSDIFSWVFGEEWRVAGSYASWQTLTLFCGFINVPAVQALALTKSQPFLLFWEVVTTFAKLSAILAGGLYWGQAEMTVAIYSCFGAIAYLILIGVSISRAGEKNRLRS